MVGSNQGNFFENATAYSKRKLKTTVSTLSFEAIFLTTKFKRLGDRRNLSKDLCRQNSFEQLELFHAHSLHNGTKSLDCKFITFFFSLPPLSLSYTHTNKHTHTQTHTHTHTQRQLTYSHSNTLKHSHTRTKTHTNAHTLSQFFSILLSLPSYIPIFLWNS